MYKLAGRILDSYDDPAFLDYPGTQKLFGSTLKDPADLDELQDKDFAVKIATASGKHRRFPVYNAEITKISCAYFEEATEHLPEEIVETAGFFLGRACEKFNIEKTASVAACTAPQLSTVASTTEMTALPGIRSEAMLSKYAERLLVNKLPTMTPQDRVVAADAFCKEASADDITEKAVWDYATKPLYGPYFEEGLSARRELSKSAGMTELTTWDAVEPLVRKAEPSDGAVLLEQFDKLAGFNTRYKDGFPDAYFTCYSGWRLPKEAAEIADWHIEATYAPNDALAETREHLVDLERRFPKEAAGFSKHAESLTCVNEDRWDASYMGALQTYFGFDKFAGTKAGAVGAAGGALTGASVGAMIPVPGAIPVSAAIGAGIGGIGGLMKSDKKIAAAKVAQ
jgi:hypothetical protein